MNLLASLINLSSCNPPWSCENLRAASSALPRFFDHLGCLGSGSLSEKMLSNLVPMPLASAKGNISATQADSAKIKRLILMES